MTTVQDLASFSGETPTGEPSPIHPDTRIASLALKVADLPRSIHFYTEIIGMTVIHKTDSQALLGAGGQPILRLVEVRDARRQPPNTTGLYHAAILWPDRRSLAVKIAQLIDLQVRFGQSDHLVSEAFYLSDPDGNGLELYRDRPRSEWEWQSDAVRMAVDPIDFDDFFSEIDPSNSASSSPYAPPNTRLGHIHLRVADIALAEGFYHGLLGFDVTASMPDALFLSAGGYHHHLGVNTWESRGGKPPIGPTAGLLEFTIALPFQSELERLVKLLVDSGVPVERQDSFALVHDPFQNLIRLESNASSGA